MCIVLISAILLFVANVFKILLLVAIIVLRMLFVYFFIF